MEELFYLDCVILSPSASIKAGNVLEKLGRENIDSLMGIKAAITDQDPDRHLSSDEKFEKIEQSEEDSPFRVSAYAKVSTRSWK